MKHGIFQILGGTAILLGWATTKWPDLPSWISWVLLAIGVAFISIELPAMWRGIKWLGRRLPIHGPMRWEFDGFLGANWTEGEAAYVACIQARGEGIRRSGVTIISAMITSRATGQNIPVLLRTDRGYAPASETNAIPRGRDRVCKGAFLRPSFKRTWKTGRNTRGPFCGGLGRI
jgi:hypothetical protein